MNKGKTMAIGLIGRKCGMARLFNDDGGAVAVTVIEVLPNRVTQVKSDDTDGYTAVQVTTGAKKASHVNKAEAGHYKKAGVEAGRGLWEFRADADALAEVKPGHEYLVDMFAAGDIIDISGTSKGKGFQGGVKRWNFHMQDATHGNSISHRAPGSIGQCQTPGRVFKGKKMAGQMGNKKITTQNLQVVKVDAVKNVILVKGSVPGAKGGDVILTPAVKG